MKPMTADLMSDGDKGQHDEGIPSQVVLPSEQPAETNVDSREPVAAKDMAATQPDPATMRKSVLEQKRVFSGRVSELCRYIAFGVLALVAALLLSDAPVAQTILRTNTLLLQGMALASAATILIDYLQYVSGLLSIEVALANRDGGYRFKRRSIFYRMQDICYWLKQVGAGIASVLLLFFSAQIPATLSSSQNQGDISRPVETNRGPNTTKNNGGIASPEREHAGEP